MLKKRGRKPKVVEEEETVVVPPKKEEEKLKKRGRKSTGKVVECQVEESQNLDETIIAHLPIILPEIEKPTINHNKKEQMIDEKNFEILPCKKCKMHEKKINDLTKIINDLNEIQRSHIYKIDLNFNGLPEEISVCWYCCHKCDNKPVGLIEKIYNKEYYSVGCFCSFSCALGYNIYFLRDTKTLERTSLMQKVYSEITNSQEIIKPAPPRESLRMFGGFMTIDKFREQNNKIDKEWRILTGTMVSTTFYIEEQVKKDENIILNNDNFKLKRTIPRQNQKNSLEKTLGIRVFEA